MKSKILATTIISGAVILAAMMIMSIASIFTTIQHNASAQTTTSPTTAINNMSDTMIGSRGDMMGMNVTHGENVTGSINLMNVIYNALGSQVKVSLSNAITTAENSVGNNSHAVGAHVGDENGYLVYTVFVLGPNMKLNKVIVDPGNGQVLLNRVISIEEHLMMHRKMMGPGMMGPGMMG